MNKEPLRPIMKDLGAVLFLLLDKKDRTFTDKSEGPNFHGVFVIWGRQDEQLAQYNDSHEIAKPHWN